MKNQTIFAASLIASALTIAAPAAHAYTGEQLAKSAKISLTEAQTAALAAEPGRIVDTELEQEQGGSGLRYSFDIKPTSGGATHELGIDAASGAVLENSVDGANPD